MWTPPTNNQDVLISFDGMLYGHLIAIMIVLLFCLGGIYHYYRKLESMSMSPIRKEETLGSVSMDSIPRQDNENSPPSEHFEKERIDSISGPTKGSSNYTKFIITLTIMICCGSCNDFLGKLIYQMFPGNNHSLHGIDALKNEYWITLTLTFGSFLICSVAIFTKAALTSYNKLNKKLFLKICVPSVMDFFVTGGRYLGLVFLSGAVVSILKNGTQLLFLALLRRCFHHKTLEWSQLFGIVITIIGLLMVAAENIVITNDAEKDETALTLKDSLIGITIMFVVGCCGAIRNDIEELLLKNDNLDSNFVVGMESIVSLLFTLIIGVILFIVDPFHNIGDKTNVFDNIYNNILVAPVLMICFALFLIAIYGKDTMQMRMTSLSSSLTRKLFQQIYPSGTWVLSLIAFAICSKYGEEWQGQYSWIRLSGFVIVLLGNYFYIKGYSFFAKWFKCCR